MWRRGRWPSGEGRGGVGGALMMTWLCGVCLGGPGQACNGIGAEGCGALARGLEGLTNLQTLGLVGDWVCMSPGVPM